MTGRLGLGRKGAVTHFHPPVLKIPTSIPECPQTGVQRSTPHFADPKTAAGILNSSAPREKKSLGLQPLKTQLRIQQHTSLPSLQQQATIGRVAQLVERSLSIPFCERSWVRFPARPKRVSTQVDHLFCSSTVGLSPFLPRHLEIARPANSIAARARYTWHRG